MQITPTRVQPATGTAAGRPEEQPHLSPATHHPATDRLEVSDAAKQLAHARAVPPVDPDDTAVQPDQLPEARARALVRTELFQSDALHALRPRVPSHELHQAAPRRAAREPALSRSSEPGSWGGVPLDRTDFLAVDGQAVPRLPSSAEVHTTRHEAVTERSLHDVDGNGLIDAGDRIFSSLGLWSPGSRSLMSLTDAGVGGLAVAPIPTPFALLQADQRLVGQLKATSVFEGPSEGAT